SGATFRIPFCRFGNYLPKPTCDSPALQGRVKSTNIVAWLNRVAARPSVKAQWRSSYSPLEGEDRFA
ncbi:hypothetical protein QMZ05_38005, partial [Bradyrhizobium sp. INPA03-11B]